ncbi:MAG: hypothetical protein GTO22_20980 [Gemmatimonadales bacterium]|nr:hypothetical protein [Gemmatimonadales bacterium]
MPQMIEISGGPILDLKRGPRGGIARTRRTGKYAPKLPGRRNIPLRELRTPGLEISHATRGQIKHETKFRRKAKMIEATRGIRLALLALANGRFEAAGNIAVNSAVEAAYTFKDDPQMATRIMRTARGVVRNAIRGIMARSV